MSPEPNLQKAADALRDVRDSETVHHIQRKGRDAERRVGQLNLTSMLDVTFQLLIFFVLTAVFALNEGVLRADLPTGPSQPAKVEIPPQTIDIALRMIGPDVVIDVNNSREMFSFSDLYEHLYNNNTAVDRSGLYEPKDPVIIKPAVDVPWDAVIGAFNAATRAKFENVNFAEAAGN